MTNRLSSSSLTSWSYIFFPFPKIGSILYTLAARHAPQVKLEPAKAFQTRNPGVEYQNGL